MHAILRLAPLLCTAVYARAVVLSASGVYTFTLGSQALSHASATAPTITAPQFTPGSRNQVWAAVVNSTSATFQNIATFSYMAIVSVSGVPAIVPSTTPFTWTIVPSNGNNKFCEGSFCLVLNGADGSLILSPINKGQQDFAANPTTPPAGAYQIQNVATGRIIAGSFVPAPASLNTFPARDRSQVWQVSQTGSNEVSLFNFDFGGILSVQPQGLTVGTFGTSQVPWTVVYVDGVGQILQTATGASMTASGTGISISGARDATAAWVFLPEDGSKFLP